MSEGSQKHYTLRTTPTVRRALAETPPEAVAAAATSSSPDLCWRSLTASRKQLLPPVDDRFGARRGTYRVIYRIDDETQVVTIVDVGRRRDIYRTR